MKGVFSTPVCARKQTNGPPVTDQGFSTGSCNCHHALPGRAVDPLQLAIERAWSALDGPFFCFLVQMGVEDV